MTAILTLLALGFIGLGGWAAVDARSFTTVVADYGAYNPHLIHDYAAASLAVGIALLVAARVPAWRGPTLGITALWNGFHAISHIVDADDAASRLLGVGEAVALVLVTILIAAVWRIERRSRS